MSVGPATGLDWRAIAAGAGATLAIGFSASYLTGQLLGGALLGIGTVQALNWGVGAIADALGGAVAGLLAKRRGAVHGAIAMLLASAFGLVATLVTLMRYGANPGLSFWLLWMLQAAVGLGIGTLAGMVAARIAATKSSQ